MTIIMTEWFLSATAWQASHGHRPFRDAGTTEMTLDELEEEFTRRNNAVDGALNFTASRSTAHGALGNIIISRWSGLDIEVGRYELDFDEADRLAIEQWLATSGINFPTTFVQECDTVAPALTA